MTAVRRVVALSLVVGGAVLLPAAAASAHPLGNFTVNTYDGVVVTPSSVHVDHVTDFAEIPTAQATSAIDRDGSGAFSAAELSSWAGGQCAVVARRTTVRAADVHVALRVVASAARTSPGAGGLPVLRLECSLSARMMRLAGSTRVQVGASPTGGRIGWHEMTARGDRTTLTSSTVPTTSASKQLTAYPADTLKSPLDVRSADVEVRPGGPALARDAGATPVALPGVAGRFTDAFTRLTSNLGGSPFALALALGAALVLGAVHALAPGHGKTVMAFYLSGQRSVRAAATVGATVTLTHTAGVLILGLLVGVGTSVAPEAVYPWLTLVSGLLVAWAGGTLLAQARRHRGHGHHHDHSHDGHHHDQGHSHDDSHDHRHDDTPSAIPNRRGLVAIGMAGGLLPSPSALVVLLGAVAVGHAWLGVGLVVAFGLGMALTLTAAGVVMCRVRSRVESRARLVRPGRLTRVMALLPVLTALTVLGLGTAVVLRGAVGVIG